MVKDRNGLSKENLPSERKANWSPNILFLTAWPPTWARERVLGERELKRINALAPCSHCAGTNFEREQKKGISLA